jgi:streptogramin lyase
VRVDRGDNIWVADKGSDVVVRFDPQGRVSMVFGRKPEASDESAHPLQHPKPPLPPIDGLFRQVTDVTWDSDDNIYISDGYINSRIARYDKDGNWLGSWGEPGSGPGQFNTPHAIVTDRQNRIYVADRGNARLQVFDTAGKLLQIIRIDVPPVAADAPVAIGNRPAEARRRIQRQRPQDAAGRAVGDVHYARTDAVPVCLRRLSWPYLQALARRQAAGLAWRLGQGAEEIRLDPQPGLPFGK